MLGAFQDNADQVHRVRTVRELLRGHRQHVENAPVADILQERFTAVPHRQVLERRERHGAQAQPETLRVPV